MFEPWLHWLESNAHGLSLFFAVGYHVYASNFRSSWNHIHKWRCPSEVKFKGKFARFTFLCTDRSHWCHTRNLVRYRSSVFLVLCTNQIHLGITYITSDYFQSLPFFQAKSIFTYMDTLKSKISFVSWIKKNVNIVLICISHFNGSSLNLISGCHFLMWMEYEYLKLQSQN